MNDASAAVARWVSAKDLLCPVEPLGEGHIHDTYVVRARNNYVLQRVNSAVYADPQLVMRQTQRVIDHVVDKREIVLPQIVPSTQNRTLELVGDSYWRMWEYLDDTSVVDPIETCEQASAAAHAFGQFHVALKDMPGPRFVDTIPGFLQLEDYLRQYDECADRAPKALGDLVGAHRHLAGRLAQRNGYIHGDCKVNNLLFDAQGQRVVALIDLDNVMFGHWAWDFGDLVRSVCFSRGGVDVDYFHACLSGFVEARGNEAGMLDYALAAPSYVALMLGVRFLTDHLNGDTYFRVRQPGENLQRAEQQFVLMEEFIEQQDKMAEAGREVLRAS